MAKIFHTTFWNYNSFKDYKPQMLRDWIELGITTPTLPVFDMYNDDKAALKAILDDAQSLGIQVLLQINTMFIDCCKDADSYRANVEAVHAEFGTHPAVYGYYVGEEPNVETEHQYYEATKIINEIAPDAAVYTNFGSIERTERMLLQGKVSIDDWVKKFKEYSGNDIIGYGCYSVLMRDNTGIYEHYDNLRTFVNTAKKNDVDVWATMLSSAHDFYRVPTVDDFRMQINSCAACGCRGIVWFRLYDKVVAGDYRGSPIDEYGVKTEHFYDLARVQKKFNLHYGEVFPKLNHLSTYGVGVSYGGYPYFTGNNWDLGTEVPLVESADCRSGLISFFRDDDGTYYVVILNTHPTDSYHMTLTFTESVEKAELVYHNGKQLSTHFSRNGRPGAIKGQSMCLAPGQIEVMKITLA